MALTVAYLTGGRIHLKSGDQPPRLIESPYAKGVHERAVRSQQRHAWKSEGEGEGGFLGGAVIWGKSAAGDGPAPILTTSLARGLGPGQLIYSLASGSLSAVCESDGLGGEERRLWNDNKRKVEHLHACPSRGDLVFSVRHANGTANVGILFKGEPGINEVTEGDSVDTAPAWVPGATRRIVYQSAGVGRNQHGHFMALGPFSVQSLDVDTAEMETLLEDAQHDYLSPRMLEDGTLYFIRRPYREHAKVKPLRVLRDTLLLPIRLLYAVFQFFNYFSMRYTGRKLSTPPGTPKRDMAVEQMMIWGNLINAQTAAGEEAADLVPSSWQLIRQRPDAGEEVLAKAVLAYDLSSDGTIAYSNGSAIFVRHNDGKTERILTEKLIEQVALVEV
jgi:hypothetical protein